MIHYPKLHRLKEPAEPVPVKPTESTVVGGLDKSSFTDVNIDWPFLRELASRQRGPTTWFCYDDDCTLPICEQDAVTLSYEESTSTLEIKLFVRLPEPDERRLNPCDYVELEVTGDDSTTIVRGQSFTEFISTPSGVNWQTDAIKLNRHAKALLMFFQMREKGEL